MVVVRLVDVYVDVLEVYVLSSVSEVEEWIDDVFLRIFLREFVRRLDELTMLHQKGVLYVVAHVPRPILHHLDGLLEIVLLVTDELEYIIRHNGRIATAFLMPFSVSGRSYQGRKDA